MSDQIEWVALSVFIFFFALVTVMGFFAARWKSGPVSEHLDEWGLGGRQFGTWITWFLVGGDFYTAYTVIAVPALIAFVKDIMIYIVVLVAVVIVPAKLGGYGAVFAAANDAFAAKGGATGLILKPEQMLPYATLALGSAFAAFMYPHTLTGIFASKSADTIRKNAILLPAYTLLLGLIALLGYMAHAAKIAVSTPNDVVPALFQALFPSWFAGFAFSAIAIGAL